VAELVLVRPLLPRVKRFFIIGGGVALGAVIFATAAIVLLSLFTNRNVSVGLANRSGTPLHNLVISRPGFVQRMGDMDARGGVGFSAKSYRKFEIRVGFEARGQHYELPARIRLAPIGDYHVWLSIDDQMRLSVDAGVL